MPTYQMVPVTSLFAQCALRVRNFEKSGWAQSDNCGKTADTAVEMEDGSKMWRCPEHRGIRHIERTGPVWNNVERLVKD